MCDSHILVSPRRGETWPRKVAPHLRQTIISLRKAEARAVERPRPAKTLTWHKRTRGSQTNFAKFPIHRHTAAVTSIGRISAEPSKVDSLHRDKNNSATRPSIRIGRDARCFIRLRRLFQTISNSILCWQCVQFVLWSTFQVAFHVRNLSHMALSALNSGGN